MKENQLHPKNHLPHAQETLCVARGGEEMQKVSKDENRKPVSTVGLYDKGKVFPVFRSTVKGTQMGDFERFRPGRGTNTGDDKNLHK